MNGKNELIGMKLGEKNFKIERGKIKEFVGALGFNDSVFNDESVAKENGLSDIIAPPTFSAAIDLWGGYDFEFICQKLMLHPKKVLHSKQSFEYHGYFYPDDIITFNGVVSNVISKKKMYLIEIENNYYNQKNEKLLNSKIMVAELK